MPTNRRRRRAGRRSDHASSKRVLMKLLSGGDYAHLDMSLGTQERRLRDDDHAAREALQAIWAEAWKDVGEELTRLHVFGEAAVPDLQVGGRNPPNPGTRPWGWWMYEAPSPLQGLKLEEPARWREECRRACWRPGPPLGALGNDGVETEPAYLRRLGLMLPGEEALLAQQPDPAA